MILNFKNVSVAASTKQKNWLIQDLSFDLKEGKNLALLIHDERIRIQTMKLLLGTIKPDAGRVIRQGNISTPIGESAIFHGEMTTENNLRFICKLYGRNPTKVITNILDYIENSVNLKSKSKTLNAVDKRKVAMALSLFLELDVYLIRGDIGHPDSHFKEKFETDFMKLLRTSTAITVSTNMQMLRTLFHSIITIDNEGVSTPFSDLEKGISHHKNTKQNRGAPNDAIK